MFPITYVLSFCAFCISDTILSKLQFEGVYYIIHSIHNALIVYSTAPEVWQTLTDISSVQTSPINYYALELCLALHCYHVAYYWRKFRYDDWLHHGLMICVALPIGGLLPSGTLLGYSLFFTTGLPGGIDYALLFLTRNNWILRVTEKKINTWLNIWIRSPGCVSHATIACIYLSMLPQTERTIIMCMGAYITALLNYWNGQYFMQQVVLDAGENKVCK